MVGSKTRADTTLSAGARLPVQKRMMSVRPMRRLLRQCPSMSDHNRFVLDRWSIKWTLPARSYAVSGVERRPGNLVSQTDSMLQTVCLNLSPVCAGIMDATW